MPIDEFGRPNNELVEITYAQQAGRAAAQEDKKNFTDQRTKAGPEIPARLKDFWLAAYNEEYNKKAE